VPVGFSKFVYYGALLIGGQSTISVDTCIDVEKGSNMKCFLLCDDANSRDVVSGASDCSSRLFADRSAKDAF